MTVMKIVFWALNLQMLRPLAKQAPANRWKWHREIEKKILIEEGDWSDLFSLICKLGWSYHTQYAVAEWGVLLQNIFNDRQNGYCYGN